MDYSSMAKRVAQHHFLLLPKAFTLFYITERSRNVKEIMKKSQSVVLRLSLVFVSLGPSTRGFVLGPPRPAFAFSASTSLSHSFRIPKEQDVSSTTLFFFGGMFGSESSSDMDADLASFSNLPSEQYDALTEYIRQWSMLFETEGGLTTPVKVVTNDKGAQILFKPKESSYKSKDEEKAAEQGEAETKKEPPKQGGVEVVVEKTEGGVQVRASRCEMDEDTMIREMSENAIVDGLKKAMKVWKKDHPV